MQDNKIQGILAPGNNKFYYLECGDFKLMNVIERIRSSLVAKDIITYVNLDPQDNTPPYYVLTLADAKERGLDIEVLYLNKHIKEVKEQTVEKAAASNPWNRK